MIKRMLSTRIRQKMGFSEDSDDSFDGEEMTIKKTFPSFVEETFVEINYEGTQYLFLMLYFTACERHEEWHFYHTLADYSDPLSVIEHSYVLPCDPSRYVFFLPILIPLL